MLIITNNKYFLNIYRYGLHIDITLNLFYNFNRKSDFMKIKETNKSLITSFIFLLFGALLFAYPNQVVETASMIFGGALMFYGVILLIKNYYEARDNNSKSSASFLLGIFLLVVGLLFIVLAGVVSQILQYVLGAWILFTGIERLMIALSLGKNSNAFITQIIIAGLLLAAGLYTILRGHLEIQIIGIIMIVYSILQIIGYFSNTTKDHEEKKKEVVMEKIETKINVEKENDDDIKEAKVVEEKPKKNKKK